MDLANKKSLPLNAVKAISDLRKEARAMGREYEDYVIYEETNQLIIRLIDKDEQSGFYFKITNCELTDKGLPLFNLKRKPVGRTSVVEKDTEKVNYTSDGIVSILQEWLNTVKEYSHIYLTEEEAIDAAAEKEIYALFDFIDKDADTSAFNVQQQLFLDNALANVAQVLETKQHEHEIVPLIEEVKSLRKSIPNETKKSIGQKLSKLFVATKKYSITLFKEVIKDFLKDAIKKGMEGGYHRMIEFFQ